MLNRNISICLLIRRISAQFANQRGGNIFLTNTIASKSNYALTRWPLWILDEMGLGLNSWNGFYTQMYEYGGEDYLAASIFTVNGRQFGAAVALIDV